MSQHDEHHCHYFGRRPPEAQQSTCLRPVVTVIHYIERIVDGGPAVTDRKKKANACNDHYAEMAKRLHQPPRSEIVATQAVGSLR